MSAIIGNIKDVTLRAYNKFDKHNYFLGLLIALAFGSYPLVAILLVVIVAAGRELYDYMFGNPRNIYDALNVVFGGVSGILFIAVLELAMGRLI